jgi:2-keto-4-pentenoate hydratase
MNIESAATTLWRNWQQLSRIKELPEDARPLDRAAGYAVQAKLAELSGQGIVGWKIAATSAAGQAHIHVDGPIAGRLLEDRVLMPGAAVSLQGNLMRVAEAEFVFRLGRDLKRRPQPYELSEVMDAVESMHLGIEVPDSRYEDFTVVGAPQLIADDACAAWFILGPAVETNWREFDLSRHKVYGYLNDELVSNGTGSNVLGDPRIALTWLVNELTQFADGIRAGEIVTTGTCIPPIPVNSGDQVRMDFGEFGSLDMRFTPAAYE